MEDTIDNCVHIKTEPADEEFEPQNTGQDCGQHSEREPVPSIETQNSGDFSSNVGYIKTEPSEQNFHHVDKREMNEKEDCPDLDVAKIISEPDEELVLKEEPDSSPYTSQQEDDVGLFSDRDAGHWAPTTQGDGVGLPSDGDASHWEELKLKDEPISPPRPVQESLIPATGNHGLLRIDVEDPLHPVQSGIVKQESEEEVELDDQKALDFDVANVKHEPLSASCTGPSESSCEAGGKNIVSDASLYQHDIFEGLRPLQSASTQSPGEATVHSHTGGKRFKCDQCDEAFAWTQEYKKHRRFHPGGKTFKCGSCDKIFDHKSWLIVHERVHTGERPFACSQCDLVFSLKGQLAQHQRTIHPTVKHFKCDKCDKSFRFWNELTMHVGFHSGGTTFQCHFCNQVFSNESDLIVHKHVHSGDRERPFACNWCDKTFKNNSLLVRHQHRHS